MLTKELLALFEKEAAKFTSLSFILYRPNATQKFTGDSMGCYGPTTERLARGLAWKADDNYIIFPAFYSRKDSLGFADRRALAKKLLFHAQSPLVGLLKLIYEDAFKDIMSWEEYQEHSTTHGLMIRSGLLKDWSPCTMMSLAMGFREFFALYTSERSDLYFDALIEPLGFRGAVYFLQTLVGRSGDHEGVFFYQGEDADSFKLPEAVVPTIWTRALVSDSDYEGLEANPFGYDDDYDRDYDDEDEKNGWYYMSNSLKSVKNWNNQLHIIHYAFFGHYTWNKPVNVDFRKSVGLLAIFSKSSNYKEDEIALAASFAYRNDAEYLTKMREHFFSRIPLIRKILKG